MFASFRLTGIMLACLLSTQSGCLMLRTLMGKPKSSEMDMTMLKMQGYSMPPGGMPAPVAPIDDLPRVVLEVRGEERHVESIRLPQDQALTVEDLVQQANLHKRLGMMNIAIIRPTISGEPPLRLESKFDAKGKPVSPGNNYALHPGDHIIVYEDHRNGFERFIDAQFKL